MGKRSIDNAKTFLQDIRFHFNQVFGLQNGSRVSLNLIQGVHFLSYASGEVAKLASRRAN
jgi:hypothetical protein